MRGCLYDELELAEKRLQFSKVIKDSVVYGWLKQIKREDYDALEKEILSSKHLCKCEDINVLTREDLEILRQYLHSDKSMTVPERTISHIDNLLNELPVEK